MKLLVLLFVLGYASAASFYNVALYQAADEVVHDLLVGVQNAPSLKRTIGLADDDDKSELEKQLRETLDKVLEKIKDAFEKGKTVGQDLIEKLKETREKMKEHRIKIGEKAKELFQKIKDKAKDFLQRIIDSLGGKEETLFADDGDDDGGNDAKEELARKLREALNRVLEKIKERLENGKNVGKDLLEKLKDLREKLKEHRIKIGEKGKELFQKIKDRVKDFLKKILDNLDDKDEDVQQADFNLKNIFQKLKEFIKSKLDKEALKEKIEKLFGKGSELADQLLALLKEHGGKGKQKILDFIDRILDEDKDKETRSLQEMWERIKNYFKDLNIDLKEKFMKFGEWVKETFKTGLDKSKDKLSNIKAIAKEFIEHTKTISKEVAVEALEFLRPYKDDIGELWNQVKEAVKEIVSRKD